MKKLNPALVMENGNIDMIMVVIMT